MNLEWWWQHFQTVNHVRLIMRKMLFFDCLILCLFVGCFFIGFIPAFSFKSLITYDQMMMVIQCVISDKSNPTFPKNTFEMPKLVSVFTAQLIVTVNVCLMLDLASKHWHARFFMDKGQIHRRHVLFILAVTWSYIITIKKNRRGRTRDHIHYLTIWLQVANVCIVIFVQRKIKDHQHVTFAS